MNRNALILFSLILLITISCEKKSEETPLDKLVKGLENELSPLSKNPLAWSDVDLKFLEPVANCHIIGLGEATHGTSEFFKAKHRILRYMVENHNYKIFAIEADFGESVFLNEAVQRSDSAAIENLMKTKMHFWTWKTREVKDLLVWMCKYNSGKSDEEKVQYVGIDCQFNTYNPGLIKAYLAETGVSFYTFAETILDEANTATHDNFKNYSSSESFNNYLKKLDALRDTLIANKDRLVQRSSEKRFELARGTLYIVRQVSVVIKNNQDNNYNYRDQYMAQNVAWLLDLFDGKKVVMWAHNSHVANIPGWMGKYLKMEMPNEYAIVGFLFSRGKFNAVGREGTQYTALKQHEIAEDPMESSINYIMSRCNEPVFAVKMSHLISNPQWLESFTSGLKYFDIGAVYSNTPEIYYRKLYPADFDYIIYIDNTNASVLLN